jgi:hypothetical protein
VVDSTGVAEREAVICSFHSYIVLNVDYRQLTVDCVFHQIILIDTDLNEKCSHT